MPKGPKIKEWIKWYIRTEAVKNRAEPRDSVAQRIEQYLAGKEPVPVCALLLHVWPTQPKVNSSTARLLLLSRFGHLEHIGW